MEQRSEGRLRRAPVPRAGYAVAGGLLLLVAATLACNLPGAGMPSTPPLQPQDEPTATQRGTTQPTSPAEPTEGLPLADHEQLTWFQPKDHYPRPGPIEGVRNVGADDYMDLFEPDAPWENAAEHVDVFTIYLQFADWASQEEMAKVVTGLEQRGIALGLETGVLPPQEDCSEGLAGFITRRAIRRYMANIRRAGGTLRFLTFDNPYQNAVHYDGPNACQWEPARAAREAGTTVEIVRESFPNVIVGSNDHSSPGPEAYRNWFDTYQEVNGEYLDFFHYDVDYFDPQLAEQARQLEGYAQERGIHFGVIYTGDFRLPSDQAYIELVDDHILTYELEAGGQPDHAVIQSWQNRPDHLLPETDPTAHTHLINRYFRPRTSLSIEAEQIPGGDLQVSGRLTKEGQAMPAAEVEVALRPSQGLGYLDVFRLHGEIPEGADQGLVGYRVNTECGARCRSDSGADLLVDSFTFRERGGGSNNVPNADFSAGLAGWGVHGTAVAELVNRESAQGLELQAGPDDPGILSSQKFPVTGGVDYELAVSARVSPRSVSTGYFTVIFIDHEGENNREEIFFEPSLRRESSTTDSQGRFVSSIAGSELMAGPHVVEVRYAGEPPFSEGGGAWPAYTKADVKIE